MFKSIWEEKPVFKACSSGDEKRKLYEKDVDENGQFYLKEVGEEDTRKIIQSYADSCSVTRIVERALAGDLVALNTNEGIWTDEDLDLTFCEGKDSKDLEKLQNATILSLYNDNKNYQSVSLEDFSKLVVAGDWKAISELKEVVNNE